MNPHVIRTAQVTPVLRMSRMRDVSEIFVDSNFVRVSFGSPVSASRFARINAVASRASVLVSHETDRIMPIRNAREHTRGFYYDRFAQKTLRER